MEVAKKLDQQERWIGIYDNLDFDIYKKAPGMNNSGLKMFHENPEKYITQKRHQKPESKIFRIGHAFHCIVCEREKFDKQYIKSKHKNFMSSEAKIWKETAESEGFFVLGISSGADDFWSPSEWDLVHRMADSVQRHPVASLLLKGIFERSIFWIDRKKGDYKGTGKLCKARLDIYNPDHSMIVDLKSAVDASMSGFQRSVNEYCYYRQHAFYLDGCTSDDVQIDVENGFVFIVVEKEEPFSVAGYKLDSEWVRIGREISRRDMEAFQYCHEKNEWPGYGWREESPMRDLAMPSYAKYHKIF